MIIIIQCAGKKQDHAGRLVTEDGQLVEFVANPDIAPQNGGCVYARPDDVLEDGVSYREKLNAYNNNPNDNPCQLLPAYQLYRNAIYETLVNAYGVDNVYILSAGWGLIRADFLTPYYDITFSPQAEDYTRRRQQDQYADFRMLPENVDEDIVFFGGRAYLPLLNLLVAGNGRRRIVFYRDGGNEPVMNEWELMPFQTPRKTNWHYGCANAFLNGNIDV